MSHSPIRGKPLQRAKLGVVAVSCCVFTGQEVRTAN